MAITASPTLPEIFCHLAIYPYESDKHKTNFCLPLFPIFCYNRDNKKDRRQMP